MPEDAGLHGFRDVTMRLRDGGATSELLKYMGYEEVDRQGSLTRLAMPGGNGADFIDLEVLPGAAPSITSPSRSRTARISLK